jgi:hypothetical protein
MIQDLLKLGDRELLQPLPEFQVTRVLSRHGLWPSASVIAPAREEGLSVVSLFILETEIDCREAPRLWTLDSTVAPDR